MNILIVTPFYKQDKNIASVRWTNIAQRLAKNHNIIIVTQPLDNDMDMTFSKTYEDGILVARMNQKTTYEKIAVKYFHGATGDDWQTSTSDDKLNTTQKDSTVRVLKNRIMFNSMKLKAKEYARQIKDNVIPKGTKIDIVISSACPFIEMLFGYELKKLLKCKWISDFRDWPYKGDCNSDSVKTMRNILRNVLPYSDCVTAVTEGTKFAAINDVELSEDKVYVITNGYSKEDKIVSLKNDKNELVLVHTGSLYGGSSSGIILFKAIKKVLERNGNINFILECAGGNNSSLIDTAKEYGLQKIVVDHGFITRAEALLLQSKADCLVVIVENKFAGGFTGKIYEYMLQRKPIISISCGKYANGETTNFVRKLRLGFAAEEMGGENDVNELSNFLEKQATLKANHKPIEFMADIDALDKYDYNFISNQIENICFSLLEELK